MAEKAVMASEFKAKCLAMLDQVAKTKVALVVTKHGHPVARVVPIEIGSRARPTMGSVRLVSKNDEDYFSTSERWEAGSYPKKP
jgi:prevent-host-death family protein